MPKRLFLVHSAAENRQRLTGQTGQPVSGFATFYLPTTGWTKVQPGQLEMAELWGGGSGFGNNEALVSSKRLPQPAVEFYHQQPTSANPQRRNSYFALNGDVADFFTFGFFGKRYS